MVKMARRRYKKSRRGGSKKIPVLATSGALVFGIKAYNGYKATGADGLMWNTVGVDVSGKFHPAKFVENMMPVIAGVGGSMVAGKMKANRYLSSIPFVKL